MTKEYHDRKQLESVVSVSPALPVIGVQEQNNICKTSMNLMTVNVVHAASCHPNQMAVSVVTLI